MKSMKFRIEFYAFLNCWNQLRAVKSVLLFTLVSLDFFFNAVDVPLKFSPSPLPVTDLSRRSRDNDQWVRDTHRWNFAIDDRVIGAARVTRGKIRFTIGTANRAELVPNAVAGSLAGRLETGQSGKIYRCRPSFYFFLPLLSKSIFYWERNRLESFNNLTR